MRYPIRIQLLVAMLSIVMLAIALATVTSVYLTVDGASRRQAGHLRRVVATITEARFPLTDSVLEQMRGLSGGEFVLLDESGEVVHSTIRPGDRDLALLRAINMEASLDAFSSANVARLSAGTYFAHRVPVQDRPRSAERRSLVVLYPKGRWWSTAHEVAFPILAAGAVAMVAGGLVIAVFADRFSRPIKAIGNRAMAIAAGRFEQVGIPPRDDEITDLAKSINIMTTKLSHYEDEVRRSERLRTLGQLGAGIAHQLRNSATGALMAVELHQRECSTGASCESLEVALRQLRLMESYLQRFLTLGSSEPSAHENVPVGELVRDVLQLVEPACAHAKIDLTLAGDDEPLVVSGDPDSLRQLLVNLVVNAIEAAGRQSEPPGRVVVELERLPRDRVVLRVKDSGPGPAAASKDRIFDPFVTEKPDGTGLGLSVARQIVEAHRGTIRWQREGEMTCFAVELPLLAS